MKNKMSNFLERYGESVERVYNHHKILHMLLDGVITVGAVITLIVSIPIHLPYAIGGMFIKE
jgi:hypothetical protein